MRLDEETGSAGEQPACNKAIPGPAMGAALVVSGGGTGIKCQQFHARGTFNLGNGLDGQVLRAFQYPRDILLRAAHPLRDDRLSDVLGLDVGKQQHRHALRIAEPVVVRPAPFRLLTPLRRGFALVRFKVLLRLFSHSVLLSQASFRKSTKPSLSITPFSRSRLRTCSILLNSRSVCVLSRMVRVSLIAPQRYALFFNLQLLFVLFLYQMRDCSNRLRRLRLPVGLSAHPSGASQNGEGGRKEGMIQNGNGVDI